MLNTIQIGHNIRNRWGLAFWSLPLRTKVKLRSSYEYCTVDGTCWYPRQKSSVSASCVFAEDPVLGYPFIYRRQSFKIANAVKLVGDDATPLLADGRILLTAKRDQPKLFREEFECGVPSVTAVSFYSGLTFSALSRLDGVYYHWLTEQLTQICLFRDYCSANGVSGTVLLRERAPKFQVASIQTIWPDVNIVSYSNAMCVEQLFVSTIPTTGFAAHPAVLDLRNELLSGQKIPFVEKYKLLYLYRKPNAWRTVENDHEVKEMVSQLGGYVVDPGDLTFIEQVEVFAKSSCIVSIFGSGLTNCLFATDADVIELAGDYNDVSFASLSSFAGNRHHRFYCKQVGENVLVNVDDLRLYLKKFVR